MPTLTDVWWILFVGGGSPLLASLQLCSGPEVKGLCGLQPLFHPRVGAEADEAPALRTGNSLTTPAVGISILTGPLVCPYKCKVRASGSFF